MKLQVLFTLFLFLLPILNFAQTADTVYINSDSLKVNSIDLTGTWRYHPGDDSIWASNNYDDSDWDTLNCFMSLESMPSGKWTGIGWFRKIFVIDSILLNKPIGININHFGASEIYLNGNLVHKFGKVSDSIEDEEIYNPFRSPVVLSLDTNITNLISIRYSNHSAVIDEEWYQQWFERAGFSINLVDLDSSILDNIEDESGTFGANFGFAGIFLALSVLYFFLFLFYARKKENLYYSIFTFLISLIFLAAMLNRFNYDNMNLFIIYSFAGSTGLTLVFPAYLGFLYSIFYTKLPKQFWAFLTIGVLISVSFLSNLFYIYSMTALAVYIFISTIEGLRVIIIALKKGKPNAKIIGIGVGVFAAFIITLFIIIVVFGQNQISGMYGILLFLAGIISLPISMSVYLAKNIASTNMDLEKQLITVKELSQKELEHQKRAAELELKAEKERAENERKSKELEEARLLQLSMLPKELPQIPNLEIEVYMQTATEVGGDYYDFHLEDDGSLTVVIGDATGHGLNAGTMVTATKSLFNSYASNPDILFTLTEMSRSIKEMNFRLLSMCLTMLKIDGNNLRISSAGMPAALIYRSNTKEVEEVLIKGMPLGSAVKFDYELRETSFNSGDTILLFSDGYPELFNSNKEMFGYEKVREVFSEVAAGTPNEIIEHLKAKDVEWAGEKVPDDDITFVVLKKRS